MVVVALQHVGTALRTTIEEACVAARVKCIGWDTGTSLTARPALVVSALAPGERRIPDALVGLMTRTYPGLALLMLCTDELIRPTVSLQEGRVTLLGPQLTVERITARLRILLAEQRGESTSGTLQFGAPTHSRCFVQEQSTRQAYYGSAAFAGAEGTAQDFVPIVDVDEARGITVLLNLAQPLPPPVLKSATEVVLSDEEDEEKERHLVEALGPGAALVHLSATSEWRR